MNNRFIVVYEMNLIKHHTRYLTEDELGHEIADLMRHGACNVQVIILDLERLGE